MRANLFYSLPFDSDEYTAFRAVRIARIHGQVWASNDAHLNLCINKEGETDSILFATKETFRSVDGVNGPHSCLNMSMER